MAMDYRASNPISTHALREEGDANSLNHLCKYVDFYPRPPRGGRPSVVSLIICSTDFYPRPPRGGRPLSSSSQISAPRNFYPRPPRGGRPPAMRCASNVEIISTHALREEGDVHGRQGQGGIPISTHALREEGDGVSNRKCCKYHKISTHALREEGDSPADTQRYQHRDFYPRPPRGGRPFSIRCAPSTRNFYPRPPRGGRQGTHTRRLIQQKISTHALREEGDLMRCASGRSCVPISTHALREEGDKARPRVEIEIIISTHALREEGDPSTSSTG